jgi:hypothetical protein
MSAPVLDSTAPEPAAATRPRRRRVDRFWAVLLLVVAVALSVRIAYVTYGKSGPCPNPILGSIPTECAVGDQLFYNAAANRLAAGDGFVEPFDQSDDPAPAADHPPLNVIVLAPVSWLGERGALDWLDDETNLRAQRYEMALLGTLLVLLIGLLGRSVAGDLTGWIAAGTAAVYPNLWVNDGLVMSETVTGITVVAALLLAVRFARRPSIGAALALGASCGLAALARAELALFVPLLAIPLALVAQPAAWGKRVQLAALATIAAGVVVLPWVGYNLSRFERTTFISTNDGIALLGSNCDPAYYGPATGLTLVQGPSSCLPATPPPGDQSEVARVYRERALRYMGDHKARVPIVVAARVARTWGVFRPGDMIDYNVGEGRERGVTRAGLVFYYPLVVLAVAGAVVLYRRRERQVLWALVVPAITVTAGVAVTYGQNRFRAAAEPSIAVLAATAVAAVLARGRPAKGGRSDHVDWPVERSGDGSAGGGTETPSGPGAAHDEGTTAR